MITLKWIMLSLQFLCIYNYCRFFYRRTRQFLDCCNEYRVDVRQKPVIWFYIISVVVLLIMMAALYYERLTADLGDAVDMWIPILAFYIVVTFIVREWKRLVDKYC